MTKELIDMIKYWVLIETNWTYIKVFDTYKEAKDFILKEHKASYVDKNIILICNDNYFNQ